MEIVRDAARGIKLRNSGITAWFATGREDLELVLLEILADGADYRDGLGAAAITRLSVVKTRLTGKPYHTEDRKLKL